ENLHRAGMPGHSDEQHVVLARSRRGKAECGAPQASARASSYFLAGRKPLYAGKGRAGPIALLRQTALLGCVRLVRELSRSEVRLYRWVCRRDRNQVAEGR